MSNDSSKIKDAADSIKGLVEAVPIYQDLVQPTAIEIGKGLQTVAKTIHIALAPISGLVWGYDKIKEYLVPALEEKLKDKVDKIMTPNPSIAGPVVEALRFSGHDETLRELFTNLLATSMNVDESENAHPSFVEIIKQLSPSDAELLKQMFFTSRVQLPKLRVRLQVSETNSSGVNMIENLLPNRFYTSLDSAIKIQCSIENLERLKLVNIYDTELDLTNSIVKSMNRTETYEDIVLPEVFSSDFSSIYPKHRYLKKIKGGIGLTNFGSNFIQSVF